MYFCVNSMCVSEDLRCDYINDCGDYSDELDGCICDPSYEFDCTTGGCINDTWICDGEKDCFDGSDEAESFCGNETGENCFYFVNFQLFLTGRDSIFEVMGMLGQQLETRNYGEFFFEKGDNSVRRQKTNKQTNKTKQKKKTKQNKTKAKTKNNKKRGSNGEN